MPVVDEKVKEKFKLKRKLFNKYKADEVDECLSYYRKKISKLKSDNFELVQKVKALMEEVDRYNENKEIISKALFMAEQIKKDAEKKAEEIIIDARARSKDIVSSIGCEAIEQKDILLKLRSYVKEYQNRTLLLFKDQLETLKKFVIKDESYDELFSSVAKELNKISNNRDIESTSKSFVGVEEELTSKKNADNNYKDLKKRCDNSTESGEDKISNGEKKDEEFVRKKFKDLKFGKNYDPGPSHRKVRFGLFKKVKQD